jgi:hypothetical protein
VDLSGPGGSRRLLQQDPVPMQWRRAWLSVIGSEVNDTCLDG